MARPIRVSAVSWNATECGLSTRVGNSLQPAASTAVSRSTCSALSAKLVGVRFGNRRTGRSFTACRLTSMVYESAAAPGVDSSPAHCLRLRRMRLTVAAL